MGQLSPLADNLLVAICKKYNLTGEMRMYTTDFFAPYNDSCFEELELEGYITDLNLQSIAPNFSLSSRTIELAATFK